MYNALDLQIELFHPCPTPMPTPHPRTIMCTDLDREEDRIAAPMQEVLVQYYGEIVHVDVHVAVHVCKIT